MAWLKTNLKLLRSLSAQKRRKTENKCRAKVEFCSAKQLKNSKRHYFFIHGKVSYVEVHLVSEKRTMNFLVGAVEITAYASFP